MAAFNPPYSIEVTLKRFVDDNKDNLPAVVEVSEGIYGKEEKDSEVRDFSNGDILRLLSIKEEVNITFDAVYSAPSKKGLITINKSYRGAQFRVISRYKDGHVYESIHALILDFPDCIQAVKLFRVDGVLIKKGDRLKLISKGMDNNKPYMTCRIIRTSETVQVCGDLKESFAKKVDKSHEVLNLADIYHRLPQRVLMVRDLGQTLRGISHGIEGLGPQFDSPMNLSKIEIVEACHWEDPDTIIRIPLTTIVSVYPRKDWGDKIGPMRDIHDLAQEAQEAMTPKAAVVVDPESEVSGCTKDTIVVVYGTSTVEYGLCEGKDKAFLLIPTSFPSKFKECANTWSTVEDLLCSGINHEVRVGTTFRQHDQKDDIDTLYENDVVQILDSTTEVFYGAAEDLEVVRMQRNRSSSGRVGTIVVPTFARGNFYETPNVLADVPLSQLLEQVTHAKVTLSRPCVSPDPHDIDYSDDLLIKLSPLEILGKYTLSVTRVSALTKDQQSDSDLGCSIVIPETKKLAVRSISRSIADLSEGVDDPKVDTIIIRVSMKGMQLLQQSTIPMDSVYSAVPPPIPTRIHQKKPPRPIAAKPTSLVRNIEGGKDETPPMLPSKGQLSPSLPEPRPSPLPSNSGKTSLSSPPQNSRSSNSFFKRIPNFIKEGLLEKKVDETRHAAKSRGTENPYNSIEENIERKGGGRGGYETNLRQPPEGGSGSDDDGDYEKPGDLFNPPDDGNVGSFKMNEIVQLLKYLEVDRDVVSNFITKGIDGRKLCTLKMKLTDDNLRQHLGMDSQKDWYSMKYFIDKSK
ncbi:uncharacterized protein LOC117304382 [Asterias rubens]|uniref:uncharacterized protein LOC117304382 n=1 Tax=Asterias rubens TaxID=7604 RepID=UPI0014552BF3|nr:uncharacterized protein LOC117304382 [Asterias rubens]